MHEMHFRNVDLNLFRVFAALLEEKSATRAGKRLGLSQSAVSHGLRRLRELMDDDLFVRSRTGLRPTPRALEIAETALAGLRMLEETLAAEHFAPEFDKRVFRVAASPYVLHVLAPTIADTLLRTAPNVKVRFTPLQYNVCEELDLGSLDMAIGTFEFVPPQYSYFHLFDETGVWVIRSDHPSLDEGVDFAKLAVCPRIEVTGEPDDVRPTGRFGQSGLRRRTSWGPEYNIGGDTFTPLSTHDSFSAISIVLRTNAVCVAPRRLALMAASQDSVTLVEPPGAAYIPFGLITRLGNRRDAAITWLLNMFKASASLI
jgi:DNA-binding transcriptional LysR family regulator